jgi:hypothetical protein
MRLFDASYERIFVRQRELLQAAGDTVFDYDGMNDDRYGAVLIGRKTGCRFAVVTRLAGVADGLNKGLRLMGIAARLRILHRHRRRDPRSYGVELPALDAEAARLVALRLTLE